MIDQSLSRSINENGNMGIRHLLIQGRYYKIDILFPLFDQMVQLIKLPSFLSTFFTIFFSFQMLIFSCWPIGDFWGDDTTPLSIITLVFWFVRTPPKRTSLIVIFVIHVALFFVTFFWFCGLVIFYLRNLRFFTWGLYLTRFILECLYPLLVCSCSSLVGSSIYMLIETSESIYWAFIIVSIIFFAGYITIYSVGNATIGRSSCLAISFSSSFTQFIPTCYISVNCILSILSYIFYVFPLYTTLVFIVVHFALMLIIYFAIYYQLPYHHKYGNILFSTLTCSQALFDIIAFVLFIVHKEISYVFLIVYLAIFVAFFVMNFFLFKRRYDKIVADLYLSPEETKNDTELSNYYQGLRLHTSETLAITYLHVGLTQMCPLFLNWSLVRFISQIYSTNYSICSVIQILSYFPTEFRQMNSLFSVATTRTDLNFIDRFLIYQVYRIKTLRQSSSSSDANERLVKLRSLTEQCMPNVVAFWRCREPSISYFESLAKEEHRVKSLWLEAIRDYPNSAKLYEEYTTFLIECVTDFHEAVQMKMKAEMIEQGKSNFAVDNSFRSLVWSIPSYVKKGILDTKGNILDYSQAPQNQIRAQTSFDTEISTMMTDVVESDSNGSYEQKIAKQILPKSVLRLACDEALKKRSHHSIAALPIMALFTLLCGFAIFIALFVYIKQMFIDRRDSINYIGYMSQTRFTFSLSDFLLLIKYIIDTKRSEVSNFDYINKFDKVVLDSEIIHNFSHASSEALQFSYQSRMNFDKLLFQIATLSLRYINIYPLALQIISRAVNLTICHNGSLLTTFPQNMKNLYSFSYFLIASLAARDDASGFYTDNDFCMLVLEEYKLATSCDSLLNGFMNYAINSGESLMSTIKVLMILCPILLFLVSFIPYFACTLIFIHHVDKMANVFAATDRKIKEEAMAPIRQDMQPTIYSISDPTLKVTENVWFNVVNFIFSLVIALLCFGMLYFTHYTNGKIDKLNAWNYNSAMRLSSSADLLTQCYHAIMLNQSNSSSFFNQSYALIQGHSSLTDLDESNSNLLKGYSVAPSISGFDSKLDDLNFKESCTLDSPAEDFHDSYRCGSADKLLATVKDLVTPILNTPNVFNGEIKRSEPLHLFHILNNHLWERYQESSIRITQLASSNYDHLIEIMILFLCLGMIMSFLIFAAGFYLQSSLKQTYAAALSELKRVPPQLIISDKNLRNILLNRNEEKSSTTSISRSVLHNSADAILCVSFSGVVEMVNPAVSSTLGFTPEQVLGQPITSFFSETDSSKISMQMDALTDPQSNAVYEDHMHCVTDSRTLIPVYLTMLGMRRVEDSSIQSYVFILRNESELLKQQKFVEEAKAKSENLLYHILPQFVVMKLNSGERDICFTVPNATIIFIDVVKFSTITKSLTPPEIMRTLSHLFLSFDKLLPTYPLITKIKLIGDIYMGAAGLFTEGANPEEHANQTIRFALNSLSAIDDTNVKLNSNIQVRIGVNSGGPIIAGVLGTDKPVFDIIGDPINVAARLQTTDIPGQIQIPQSTYDLLAKGEYNVEQRGEVFLKGKGQVMTYLIMPEI